MIDPCIRVRHQRPQLPSHEAPWPQRNMFTPPRSPALFVTCDSRCLCVRDKSGHSPSSSPSSSPTGWRAWSAFTWRQNEPPDTETPNISNAVTPTTLCFRRCGAPSHPGSLQGGGSRPHCSSMGEETHISRPQIGNNPESYVQIWAKPLFHPGSGPDGWMDEMEPLTRTRSESGVKTASRYWWRCSASLPSAAYRLTLYYRHQVLESNVQESNVLLVLIKAES